MLKHMSSRSQSRDSVFEIPSDLDETKSENDDVSITLSEKLATSNASYIKSSRSLEENDITNLLTKPEIQRIILRRKSDLIKKELNKLDQSLSEENKFDSKEVIEKIQQDNSTYLVHKRKKDPSTSSIAEMPLENKSTSESGLQETIKGNLQKESWKFNQPQPLAASSPSNESNPPSIISSREKQLVIQKKLQHQGYEYPKFKNHNKRAAPPLRTHSLTRIDSNYSRRSIEDMYLRQYASTLNLQSNTARSLTLPNRDKNSLVKRGVATQRLLRKDQFRQSKQSISASSSISNIPPNLNTCRSCACSTVGGGRLSQINEMVEHEDFLLPSNINYKHRVDKFKCCVILFISLALISCIVGGFLHFYVGNFPEDVTLNEGDIRFVPLSSLFCSGLRATSDESKIRLVAFDKNGEEEKLTSYSRKSPNFKLYPLKLWKRQYYLLAGSSVTISIESNYLLEILVFQGEKSFSMWSERKQSETYARKEFCCSNKSNKKGNITFTAKQTDYYFIVVNNNVEVIPVDIKSIELKFKRTSYTFSRYTSLCKSNAGETCVVDYSFNTEESLALEVPLKESSTGISTAATFKYECRARVWFYCLFFIGIFAGAFTLALIFYYVTVRICIPPGKCCVTNDEKNINKFDLPYYNNFYQNDHMQFTNGNQYLDSISYTHSIAASRRSNRRSIFGDTTSQCSRTHQKNCGSLAYKYNPALSTREIGITNDIAAIYKEELGLNENADSGISLNPEISMLSVKYTKPTYDETSVVSRPETVKSNPMLDNATQLERSKTSSTVATDADTEGKKTIDFESREIFI